MAAGRWYARVSTSVSVSMDIVLLQEVKNVQGKPKRQCILCYGREVLYGV